MLRPICFLALFVGAVALRLPENEADPIGFKSSSSEVDEEDPIRFFGANSEFEDQGNPLELFIANSGAEVRARALITSLSTHFSNFQKQSGNKQCIYTILTGGYDAVPPLNKEFFKDTDVFLITDDPKMDAVGYEKVVMNVTNQTARVMSREFKMRPHNLLKSYSKSLYIDANVVLAGSVDRFFAEMEDYDIGAIIFGRNMSREAEWIEHYLVRFKYAKSLEEAHEIVQKQVQKYLGKYPDIVNQRSLYGKVIFRSHTEKTADFNECWHKEFTEGVKRDQLSFRYCTLEANLNVKQMRMDHIKPEITWSGGHLRHPTPKSN